MNRKAHGIHSQEGLDSRQMKGPNETDLHLKRGLREGAEAVSTLGRNVSGSEGGAGEGLPEGVATEQFTR